MSTFKIGGELEVNRLGYGAMQLTGRGVFGDASDRDNAVAILRAAVAAGVQFIDTAEAYGPRYNETLIRDALYPYAPGVIVATKGGYDRPGPGSWIPNGEPAVIRSQIEGSLKRLHRDTIDLWQLHRIDPKIPVEDTLGPVADAVAAGKIRYVGLSEVSIDQIERAEKVVPVVSVQNLYNLGNRQWEDVLDYTIRRDMAFIPWYPLASGPQKLEARVGEIAEKHRATTAQIALAWLLKRAPNILLIPGTKSPRHLAENMQASAIQLTDDEFAELTR